MTINFWRALSGLCIGIWAYLALFRGGFWRLREYLPECETSQTGIRVSAVIPARDEAGTIARVVESLRAQHFSGSLSITVSDDESSDATAEIARAAGASLVVRVPERPGGWKGKLWALDSGISGIRAVEPAPDFFLLTDADIEYVSANALTSLVAKAEQGFDLVSVMVRLHAESLAEKILISAFVFFFFQLYPPAWVASARPTAAAAGGVMLIRPSALAAAGGIEAIHGALIDDCALARRVKSSGGRVWLGVSRPAIRSVRGYGGIGGIRAMIARSAFAQLHHSFWLLLATLCGLAVTHGAPPALLFSGDLVATLAGVLVLILMAMLFYPTVRDYDAPFWVAFCLPAIALFYGIATIESAVNYWSGRGGVWKGRVQDQP
jgi:hopene-associated glycosyltransferase HpnB